MAEPLAQAGSRLVECCALLALGHNLKQAGLLKTSDGETAIKVATTLTLPCAIVQALSAGGPLGLGSLPLLGVAAVCVGGQVAAAWLYCLDRSPRERSVLAGCCCGLSLPLYGYPLVDAFLAGPAGAAALQAVALVDVVNHAAVWIGSYLLSAGAGPAFPEAFPHEDGGSYRGQWRGLKKEGLGVYTYGSGARYEGEWRDNLKEGRGVYHFPKGGVYEGEWAGGSMTGLGVRTLSSGQVKAGRWRDGRLEAPLELWQVALAADGAAAVATAARGVEVGGGRLADAAGMLAAQPTLWALAAGVALNLTRSPLPPSLEVVTGVLAAANTPLLLLAAGITAPAMTLLQGPPHLLADVCRLLAARLLVPLAVGVTLLLMAAMSARDGGRAAAAALLPLAAVLVALLAPVPPQALANARRFRLNEASAAALSAASHLACLPLMLLAGAAACAAGLAGPAGTAAVAAALPGGAAAAAVTVDARPLLGFTAAAIAAVSVAVRQVSRPAIDSFLGVGAAAEDATGGGGRVLMVYAGPVGAAAEPRPAADGVPHPASSTSSTPPPEPGAGAPTATSASAPSSSGGTTGAGSGGKSGGGVGGPGSGGGGTSGGGGAQGPRPPPPSPPPGSAQAVYGGGAAAAAGPASSTAGTGLYGRPCGGVRRWGGLGLRRSGGGGCRPAAPARLPPPCAVGGWRGQLRANALAAGAAVGRGAAAGPAGRGAGSRPPPAGLRAWC